MKDINQILTDAEKLMEEADKEYSSAYSAPGIEREQAGYSVAAYKGIRALYEQNKAIILLLKKIAKIA